MSARVDALLKSKIPEDAYKAYKLAALCLGEREGAAVSLQYGRAPQAELACGDLSAGQLSSRLVWLEQAAEAGVHGAAYDYAREVLDVGNPQTPKDPEALARVERYLRVGAEHGDKTSLMTLGDRADNAGDQATALKYWSAVNELTKLETGKGLRDFDNVAQRLRQDLSASQATAALAAGEQLAATSVRRTK